MFRLFDLPQRTHSSLHKSPSGVTPAANSCSATLLLRSVLPALLLLLFAAPCWANSSQTKDYDTPQKWEIPMNDSTLFVIQSLTPEEYTILKASVPAQPPKEYTAITDYSVARELIGDRLRIAESNSETGKERCHLIRVYFDDGTSRVVWRDATDNVRYWFNCYYPEFDLVLLGTDADTENVVDLNDPRDVRRLGNPKNMVFSPDRKRLFTSYWGNMESETNDWALLMWDEQTCNYLTYVDSEVSYAHYDTATHLDSFDYATERTWLDDSTIIYSNLLSYPNVSYYKLSIVRCDIMHSKYKDVLWKTHPLMQ